MEKKFIDGLKIEAPHEKAPDFVKAKGAIKRDQLVDWLRQQSDEWINFNVKVSRNGNWYCEVDTWKPKEKQPPSARKSDDMSENELSAFINQGNDDGLPF